MHGMIAAGLETASVSKAERKSWSQETVSLQLPRIEAKANAFMTTEKRMMLLIAAKTALAAGICYSVARLAGLQDGYWGAISAIIVLQSNVGSTVTASRDRLIGTLIGAAFGAAFSLLGQGLWPYLLAVVAVGDEFGRRANAIRTRRAAGDIGG